MPPEIVGRERHYAQKEPDESQNGDNPEVVKCSLLKEASYSTSHGY
jgi:hypothetical protein